MMLESPKFFPRVCLLLCLVPFVLSGIVQGQGSTESLDQASFAGRTLEVDLGRGPVTVHLPASYSPDQPTPLVLLLHGYGGNGLSQEAYMRFLPHLDRYGFLYAYPDGTLDFLGLRFWEATDACDSAPNVDDSRYLRELIEAIALELNVDDERVYLIGHSNGACMSFRMACEHSERIAAIASLAGSSWLDPSMCGPSEPVHVLEIHGTADTISKFEGGCVFGDCYPGAIDTVSPWVGFNGCNQSLDFSQDPLDLDANLPGAETVVVEAGDGCSPNGSVALWVMREGDHSPTFTSEFSTSVLDYLFSKKKQLPKSDPMAQ